MNKRIQNFADQCWSHYINGVLIDGHLHFDYEKFAKMIINECANIAGNPAPGAHTSLGRQIKEHFGVEK